MSEPTLSCICAYDPYEPHRRTRNPNCHEHGERDRRELAKLTPGAPPTPEGLWQCPHCGDIYGPEDVEEGDIPPVCYMCRKAGRT